MLRSDLCDHIVVKGAIDFLAAAANEHDKAQKNITFKNYAAFMLCISKIKTY